MRTVALLFVGIYLLFAYWQINDPNPILWITLYLVSAFVSLKMYQKKNNLELLIVLQILYSSMLINSWVQITAFEGFFTPGHGLSMKSFNQELARETAGLMICLLTFIVYMIYTFSKKSIRIKNWDN
ncbi:MAG: transmembrane 220 family protein [Bacteroidetes bacterium]|nr:transmembrane 220 family protein [Bacteroidota bacterium]HET6243624.1 transmembrane 220 family protein [Bacteroidia bacterium]